MPVRSSNAKTIPFHKLENPIISELCILVIMILNLLGIECSNT